MRKLGIIVFFLTIICLQVNQTFGRRTKKCLSPNEEYARDADRPQNTCQNYGCYKQSSCPGSAKISDCYCKKGYARAYNNGPCISITSQWCAARLPSRSKPARGCPFGYVPSASHDNSDSFKFWNPHDGKCSTSSNYPDYLLDFGIILKDDPSQFRNGEPPNYDKVNEEYFRGRSKIHTNGSIEDLTNNLIKSWEKEVTHKPDPKNWRTVDKSKFKVSVNGGKWLQIPDLAEKGNYNVMIGDSEFYAASTINLTESVTIFRTVFADGFAWELLEVFTRPPKIAFTWRHWGKMTGKFMAPLRNGTKLEVPPNNKQIELYATSIATVDDKYRITKMETFINTNNMFAQMMQMGFPDQNHEIEYISNWKNIIKESGSLNKKRVQKSTKFRTEKD